MKTTCLLAGGFCFNDSLGGLKFGTDGDGNYGYYGADGSLIPFSGSYTSQTWENQVANLVFIENAKNDGEIAVETYRTTSTSIAQTITLKVNDEKIISASPSQSVRYSFRTTFAKGDKVSLSTNGTTAQASIHALIAYK